MKVIKLALVPMMLLLGMFCFFGLLASREPTDSGAPHYGWFIFYGLVGVISLATAFWLVWSSFRTRNRDYQDDWD